MDHRESVEGQTTPLQIPPVPATISAERLPTDPAPTTGRAIRATPGGTRHSAVLPGTALHELADVDRAVYRAIASTPTPTLDRPLRRLSGLANNSKLWLGAAGALSLFGGRAGRRAAVTGSSRGCELRDVNLR